MVLEKAVVPDEADDIHAKLLHWCDDLGADLVLTTGGTGFAVRWCCLVLYGCQAQDMAHVPHQARDITPEATRAVIQKPAPGFVMAMLQAGMKVGGAFVKCVWFVCCFPFHAAVRLRWDTLTSGCAVSALADRDRKCQPPSCRGRKQAFADPRTSVCVSGAVSLAACSRGWCALRCSLILNTPGNPKAVGESLEALHAVLPHCFTLIRGRKKPVS